MRYLWILLIPMMAFAGLRGDKDPGNRDTYTGDAKTKPTLEDDVPSGGGARSAYLSDQVPWNQIEQWIIFDELSQREVLRRLDESGIPVPGGSDGPPKEGRVVNRPGAKGSTWNRMDDMSSGWGRFFSPIYHGPKEQHIVRFHSIPDRKKSHTSGGVKSDQVTSYRETCRAWTARVRGYWRRYHEGEPVPQLPCTPEPLPVEVGKRIDPPHKPPPKTVITDVQAAAPGPTVDHGVRTTYKAEDGRPAYQGQNNPGYHRADGSASLSSGSVIVEINTGVGAGRNDLTFQSVNSYYGRAWSTDTSNANSYIVYPLSKTKVLIKSSSGTDTSTVNFRVEGD